MPSPVAKLQILTKWQEEIAKEISQLEKAIAEMRAESEFLEVKAEVLEEIAKLSRSDEPFAGELETERKEVHSKLADPARLEKIRAAEKKLHYLKHVAEELERKIMAAEIMRV